MTRFAKAALVVVACLACLFLLFASYVDRDIGHGDQKEIEQELRAELPVGSTVSEVEESLAEKGIQHSFQPSTKIEYANVRKIAGSNMLIIKDLGFKFYFDDALRLKLIETRIHLTGP